MTQDLFLEDARSLAPEAVRDLREAVPTLEAPGSVRRLVEALGRPHKEGSR